MQNEEALYAVSFVNKYEQAIAQQWIYPHFN